VPESTLQDLARRGHRSIPKAWKASQKETAFHDQNPSDHAIAPAKSPGLRSAPRPANPFGSIWIDLGNDVAIHGSAEAPSSYDDRLGCISLSPRDARDVYGILSIGSEVIIR
jgi:lipoprotein-anchoring transpeptidase ErfK/SrfK